MVSAWCNCARYSEVHSCYSALPSILPLVILFFTLLFDNMWRGQHAGLTVGP